MTKAKKLDRLTLMFDSITVLAECTNIYTCPTAGKATTLTTATSTVSQSVNFDFYDFVSNFNYFALAFTMFYSFVLMTNFYYWRVISHRERLHHEAKGVKSIQDIVKFWVRYLATLLIFTFVSIYRENVPVAMVLLGVYAIFYMRMFWFDTYNLMESTGEAIKQLGWKFNWPNNIVDKMKGAKISLGGGKKKAK